MKENIALQGERCIYRGRDVGEIFEWFLYLGPMRVIGSTLSCEWTQESVPKDMCRSY